jgi:hypothetical protein
MDRMGRIERNGAVTVVARPGTARILLGLALPGVLLGAALAAASPAPPAKGQRASAVKPADNSYCLVCHANFKSEPLAHKHQMAGVGCRSCHGRSDKHASDENNITPPDIMFSNERIAGACTACHASAGLRKLDARLHQSMHAQSIAIASPAAAAGKVCTDCHGAHHLTVRTRRWDRNTGKLITDDGVRMVKERKPQ